MEAEVLNEMMADVNGNNKIADAELEVKKLQELVRKLERQNEQLRTRANGVNNYSLGPHPQSPPPCPHGGSTATSCPVSDSDFAENCCVSRLTTPAHPCVLAPEEPFEYFHPSSPSEDAGVEDTDGGGPSVLDELEVLDLDVLLPVLEADSWLYVSSKVHLWGQPAVGPLQWCRLVLDHATPELELARRTICHRLDQAKRWRGVSSLSVRPWSCMEGLSSLSGPTSCPILPFTKPATLTQHTALFSPSSHPLLQQSLPGRGTSSLADRAPTFLSHSTLHSAGRRKAVVSPQGSLDSEVGVSELEDDPVSTGYKLHDNDPVSIGSKLHDNDPVSTGYKPHDDSISMGYKLHDMTDVQVMARLQEESLRQEYASSSSASLSRRSSSFSLTSLPLRRGHADLEEEEEEDDDDEGYDQLPPPQPRLVRAGSLQRGGLSHSHTFSSIRDYRRSPSTYSLPGSSQYLQPPGTPSPSSPHYSLPGSSQYLHPPGSSGSSSPHYSLPGSSQYLQPPGTSGPGPDPQPASRHSSDKLRRSMPNLLRAPSMPCVPSVPSLASPVSHSQSPITSSLRNSQSFDSSNGLARLQSSIPSPGQLMQRVQSVGNFPSSTQRLKATAYVSPTVQQAPSSSSTPLNSSVSLHSIPCSAGIPQPLKTSAPQAPPPRSGLPRPASAGGLRPSKIAQPTRSLLTPPKSLAALSALRDGSWKEGCY